VKPSVKYSLLAAGLLASGALRTLWEKPISQDFLATGLLTPPLSPDSRDRIDQTGAAVALGGLRTLVATFLNLRGTTLFTERRWSEVAETYDTIVNLAPHTRYYWLTASWHLANNAASDYRWESDLVPMRRRQAWRESIERGKDFLKRGIRNNPDDWELHATLGRLQSDPERNPDFPAALESFRNALATGKASAKIQREELFALARCPGREKEALALARKLYANPSNRVTTLVSLLFVLEERESPSKAPDLRAIELFGSPKAAYRELGDFWVNTKQRYPVDGIAAALQGLEWRLLVPEEKSIFKIPLPPEIDPNTWFGLAPDAPPAVPRR
jgi:tetratricopeptide (TPR) repeat protein